MTSPVVSFVRAWTAGIGARDAQAVSALFDDDVLFCATAPDPLRGPEQVREYYRRVPEGLQVEATVLAESSPLPGVAHGVVAVVFTAPGGVLLRGRLGVSLVLREDGWRVSQYHLAAQGGLGPG